jgi:hypothetical protein
MPRKANHKLTPAEVIAMPLKEFEARFGFRPRDAIEKHYFASNAKRPSPIVREALAAGVLGDIDYSHVVMED